jgi:CheY-like chemotaxis protein
MNDKGGVVRLMDFVILLVEDNPDEVLLTKRALSRANLVNPLRVVKDGKAAIEYLSAIDRDRYPKPSLILLDLQLPGLSGLEVLEWIRSREETRPLPVVILTGTTDQNALDRAKALGIKAWRKKPIQPDDLLSIVQSMGMYWVLLHSRKPTGASDQAPPDPLPTH